MKAKRDLKAMDDWHRSIHYNLQVAPSHGIWGDRAIQKDQALISKWKPLGGYMQAGTDMYAGTDIQARTDMQAGG